MLGLMSPTMRCGSVAMALLLLVAGGLLARPAEGAEKVWGFKGTISSYASGGGFVTLPDAPIGSVVRGQFRFEDTESDLIPATNAGSYPFIALAVAIEGTSLLHLVVTNTGTIETENDLPVASNFRDKLGISVGSGTNYPDLDLDVIGMELGLTEVAGAAPTVLTSDALPASPPLLVGFTTEQLLNIIGYTNSFANVANFDVAITEFEDRVRSTFR